MTAVYNLHTIVLKKLILLFFTTLGFLLLAFVSPTFAQTPQSYPPVNTAFLAPQSPHSASLAIYNFSHALECILTGQSPIAPCLEYKPFADAQGMVKSIPVLSSASTNNGVLGAASSSISQLLSTPPIQSSEFIADLGEQIGVKSAHAQVTGSGNGVLAPVFALWEVSRNIAYLVMIIVFVVIGLMVMFRQKLNPQTVVSIQLALPGLVIGLLMITFSYFLASVITDIAFIGTNIVGYYFQQVAPPGAPDLLNNISRENPTSIMSRFANTLTNADYTELVRPLMQLEGQAGFWFNQFVYFMAAQYADSGVSPIAAGATFITGLVGNRIAHVNWGEAFSRASTAGNVITQFTPLAAQLGTRIPGLGGDPSFWVNIGLKFIILAAMLFTLFRLLYTLIKNYLGIIFYTIFSPFVFLIASLPGRQGMVTSWMRNMLCHVLAFPAVIAVIYFAYYLLTGSTNVIENGALFRVNSVTGGTGVISGSSVFPLLGGINSDSLRLLLAIGALFATPSVPDVICKLLGKEGPAGQMLGGAVMGVWGGGQKYLGQNSQQFQNFGKAVKAPSQPFQRQLGFHPEYYTEYDDQNRPIQKTRYVAKYGAPRPIAQAFGVDSRLGRYLAGGDTPEKMAEEKEAKEEREHVHLTEEERRRRGAV